MREGWQQGRLGELCGIQLGKTPARANASYWDPTRSSGNIWLSIADLLKSEGNNVSDSKEYLSDKGAKLCKIIKKGTLLVSFKLTLGRIAFAGRDLYTNEAIAALTIYDENTITREYLFYFLHFFDWVKAAQDDIKLKGMTLNKAKLKEIFVIVPPLPEQRRIVAILDEAFAGIATAVANTEKNLANARELFESYLNTVFGRRGEGWIKMPLKKFAKCVSTGPFGSMLHKSDYVSVGVPLVNPINIVDGEIQPDVRKMVSLETRGKLQPYILQAGDIVIARRGEIGRCAVVTKEQEGWVCGTGCFFVRPENTINSEFLAHMLRSSGYRSELERLSSGATMLNLSNSALSNLRVSAPKPAQQKEIVDQISELLVQCQEVQSIYRRKLLALAELKQSLLQKAFSGELTADKEVSNAIHNKEEVA